MLLWKKVLIGVLIVAVLAAVAITLGIVLTRNKGCKLDSSRLKMISERGQISHINKLKIGLPPIDVPMSRATTPDEEWITQRIDHFNPTDLRTWQMRYLNNSEFYVEGGPMFVFLGGEWAISAGYLMTGQMYDMAMENDGYMFYTEHRYYGQSFPTENLDIDNMQYLSADQALADIAYFIEYQKSVIPGMENSKVVVVGGSYSAMLATWMRVKYPHMVDAALSSSAPLRAVADFYEYYEVVSDSLKLASEKCVGTIKEAISEVEICLETEEGVEDAAYAFRTCWPIDNTEPSRSYFFSNLAGPFASLVQYAAVGSLDDVCSQLLSFSGNSLDKFLAFYNAYYAGYCISDYNYYVNLLSDTAITSNIFRQWIYQTCTEYGFYQTSASTNQPFKNFNLDLYVNICADVFGITEEALNTGVERTNLLYGSTNPDVTKVVSVHGTVDPWHPLGALENINSEAPVFVVEGTAHCADLTNSDFDAMIAVKAQVRELIAEWIK